MTTTAKIIEEIKRAGPNGITAPEIRTRLKIPAGTASSRTSTLLKQGKVAKWGTRTRAGFRLVWVGEIPTIVPMATIKNHVILVLDASSSIHNRGLTQKIIDLANAKLKVFRDAEDQDTIVSVHAFGGDEFANNDNRLKRLLINAPVKTANVSGYVPYGWTPLMDGVARAAEEASQEQDRSVLIYVLTDGEENRSRMLPTNFARLIREKTNTGRFTFAFCTTVEGRRNLLGLGVPVGNITVWSGTLRDVHEAEEKTSGGATAYVEARRRGVRQTKQYFEANLANLDGSLNLLRRVDGEVVEWNVEKEQSIQDLLTARTKGLFQPGEGFYQHAKREGKVPADRKILLRDRRDGAIYADGSKTVRALCGYPEGREFATRPGNHGNFDVFVQSKSSTQTTIRARLLPRGTKVLWWKGCK